MNARTVLWILVFFGFWINYMLRNNINIAIVAMVREKEENEVMKNECFSIMYNYTSADTFNETSTKPSIEQVTFDWDEYEQGLIMSSYFWLHWATELPGGILSHHYGTKVVLGVANFLSAVTTFVIPFAAKWSFNALMGLRIVQGFVAGVVWPSVHGLTAKWIPPKERGTFVSSYLGSSVGVAFTYAISGYIIDWYGWEYVFYIQALLGILWSIAWLLLAYESPSVHPWISSKERNHILNSIGDAVHDGKLPIPWKSILTSRAVWINNIVQFGTTWGLFALITLSPTYLKFIHGLHIKSTGIFSGIPHISRWIFAYMFGIIAQYQTVISLSKIRKLATMLCTVGVGIMVFIISFSGCNVTLAVTLLIVAVTLQGTIPAGPMAVLIDISPNFSAVTQGISGTLSVLSGFICPILVGYLTKNNQTSTQWQKFFIITGSICCICGISDLLFGTSKLQSWNYSEKKNVEEEKCTQMKLLSKKEQKLKEKSAFQ